MILGGLLIIASLAVQRTAHVDPGWTRVSGQIVDVSRSIGSKGGTAYSPIVQYTVSGQIYAVTGNFSSEHMPHIGSAQRVAYNPAQPAQAKVISGSEAIWLAYGFLGLGIVCIATVIGAYLRLRRRMLAY